MNSSIPNRLERALAAATQDASQKPALITALLEEPLWFPVAYHPGQPSLLKPQPGDHVEFCIGKDDEGLCVAVFTSRAALKNGSSGFRERLGIATMKGRDTLAALARQGHAVLINPGAKFRIRLARETVQRLASGESPLGDQDATECTATLRNLTADLLPPDLLGKIVEECRLQPDIFGLWLMDLAGTTGPADLRHLHAILWLRDFRRTPTDDLFKVLRLAAPGYVPEMMRLDEANYAEQLNLFRTLPALYSRPSSTGAGAGSLAS